MVAGANPAKIISVGEIFVKARKLVISLLILCGLALGVALWRHSDPERLAEYSGPEVEGLTWKLNIEPHPVWGYISKYHRELLEGLMGSGPSSSYRVVILGESFASEFGHSLRDGKFATLLREEVSALAGREIEVYGFGCGGCRQPQFLNMATFLAPKVDLIIQIEGNNEFIHQEQDQFIHFSNPLFAFRFSRLTPYRRALFFVDDSFSRLLRWTTDLAVEHEWLQRSRGYFLLWSTEKAITLRLQQFISQRVKASLNREFPVNLAGAPAGERVLKKVDFWRETTRKESHLNPAGGAAKVVFFISPSAYIEGSKNLTANELKNAIDEAKRENMRQGYTALGAAAKELRAEGIPVFNLRDTLKQVEGDIYADDTGHMNDRGYAIIGSSIAKSIHEVLSKKVR